MIFMIHGHGRCWRPPAGRRRADTIGVMQPATARTLYAHPPERARHRLDVGSGHVLSVREHGAPDGIAAVVLHGGPGSGTSPLLRRFFDPARYRIVCIDQRGAGESTPRGATHDNTTVHLLADLRRVREHLGLARWLVVGGSWGATLALAHALDEPDAVSALLLRGTWLARPADLARFFAGATFGDGLDSDDLATRLDALAKCLQDGSVEQQRACALAWWRWEQRMARPAMSEAPVAAPPDVDALIGRYRVQSHYLRHGCWVQQPPLLQRCASLAVRPVRLLHGTLDRICPPDGAQAVHQAVPNATLQWIDGAGHDPSHPGMVDAMVRALDAYASHGLFDDAPAAAEGSR
jgi:proline iminopeptidase